VEAKTGAGTTGTIRGRTRTCHKVHHEGYTAVRFVGWFNSFLLVVQFRLAALQEEIQLLAEENEKQKNAPREASNLKDCRLSSEASAHDVLSAMRGILTSRCPDRPYMGLKKALAAEAEVPGKVTWQNSTCMTPWTHVACAVLHAR